LFGGKYFVATNNWTIIFFAEINNSLGELSMLIVNVKSTKLFFKTIQLQVVTIHIL